MSKIFKITMVVFFVLVLSVVTQGQDSSSSSNSFSVQNVYPYISISKDVLNKVNTVSCFSDETNRIPLEFSPSWVSHYKSIEITALCNGKTQREISYGNDSLSLAQKELMHRADTGTEIRLSIDYLPQNNLTSNSIQNINYSFSITPDKNALYPGGKVSLEKYLRENAIDKIPEEAFRNYDMTAIKFTIDKNGDVVHAHIFGSEYDALLEDAFNEQLLETIQKMPCWSPAQYADGTLVSQEFVLTLGNVENCVVNLLNIKRDENY